MKKSTLLVSGLSAMLILSACGQGDGDSTPIDNTGGNELNEENNGSEENEENNEEANEEVNDENEVNDEENAENEANDDENAENEAADEEINEENEPVNEDTTDNAGNNDEENNAAEEEENSEEAAEDVAVIDGVELYFSDDQLMEIYRVQTDVSVTADENGALEAYQLWASGPDKNSLVSLLPEGTQVQSVSFTDGTARVSFSDAILEANLGSSGELMLTEQIALIAKQFGYDRVQILIEGSVPDVFLGHMEVDEPIEAGNPESYQTMD
ncbi:GerMN domain-containing protein [Evansella sp. LMS18]|uniref:GerMN domain-containing protein n=1 Tax=Evansella sp. LMS18 TaxID=2924033 RepID=UPI0020D0837E|nr:GerMN domain-containing protein [Evansella sp. LMS18]UTR08696.1 GerMN domain-containing protein [Evansella sp. LMS18]